MAEVCGCEESIELRQMTVDLKENSRLERVRAEANESEVGRLSRKADSLGNRLETALQQQTQAESSLDVARRTAVSVATERDSLLLENHALLEQLRDRSERLEDAESDKALADKLYVDTARARDEARAEVERLRGANDALICENQCAHDEADEIGMLLPEPPNGDCQPVAIAHYAADKIDNLESDLAEVEMERSWFFEQCCSIAELCGTDLPSGDEQFVIIVEEELGNVQDDLADAESALREVGEACRPIDSYADMNDDDCFPEEHTMKVVASRLRSILDKHNKKC